jgi:energy-coupling factor transporter ATP-binding protein EcfA2
MPSPAARILSEIGTVHNFAAPVQRNGPVPLRVYSRLDTIRDKSLERDIQSFAAELSARLYAGSHLILFGPRASGKSTLLKVLCGHYETLGIPHGVAPQTSRLPDIVAALADAYPDVSLEGLSKRVAAARLRLTADVEPGVLLLDHTTLVTTAMLGYLRRLRGGIAGALMVVDIDSPREQNQLKSWQVGALSVRMPLHSSRHLRQLLSNMTHAAGVPPLLPRNARYITRMARGRIGWLKECARRLQMQEYWRASQLRLAEICMDSEFAVRESRRGPRLLRRRGQA